VDDLRKAAEKLLEALENPKVDLRGLAQVMTELRQALAQPEQEPAKHIKTYKIVCPHCDKPHDWTYLKGEWVGLTDDEKHKIVYEQIEGQHPAAGFRVANCIEAKLKEKNT
jgi:hypothetical protein